MIKFQRLHDFWTKTILLTDIWSTRVTRHLQTLSIVHQIMGSAKYFVRQILCLQDTVLPNILSAKCFVSQIFCQPKNVSAKKCAYQILCRTNIFCKILCEPNIVPAKCYINEILCQTNIVSAKHCVGQTLSQPNIVSAKSLS